MPESWSARRPLQPPIQPPLQRLDRLMSAGRQLVDGVSGARPGSRSGGRPEGRLPRLEGLGRWVENKLDWILEDEDDWREPWQEPPAPVRPSRRRPLEARSRRTADPAPADWPDDSSFMVSRWQRPVSRPAGSPSAGSSGEPQPKSTDRTERSESSSRALPRSSRRRPGD